MDAGSLTNVADASSNFSQGGMHFATQNAPLLNYVLHEICRVPALPCVVVHAPRVDYSHVCAIRVIVVTHVILMAE